MTSNVRVLVPVLATPFPNQIPTNAPGKEVEDWPITWIPPTHKGDQDGVPGYSLDPELTVSTIWSVNQGIEVYAILISLYFLLSLYRSIK